MRNNYYNPQILKLSRPRLISRRRFRHLAGREIWILLVVVAVAGMVAVEAKKVRFVDTGEKNPVICGEKLTCLGGKPCRTDSVCIHGYGQCKYDQFMNRLSRTKYGTCCDDVSKCRYADEIIERQRWGFKELSR